MATPNAPSRQTCPLGVTDRTLSALRDDALSATEVARLAAHVETCPACRTRLDGYDTLATLLRSERPPEPDARLWRVITTTAASPEQALHVRRQRWRRVQMAPSRPSLRGLRAIAALLLITAGLATLLLLHHPSSTVQPTPTATPTLSPGWHPVASPTNVTGLGAIQPAGDGVSAYACAVNNATQGGSLLQIWHTSNRGAQWSLARTVPSTPTANACSLVVDTSDPSVAALAWAPRGDSVGDPYTGLMTTVDGGVTWQAAPSSPSTRIDQLDSRNGVIYAIRETVEGTNAAASHLWSSGDRMRTWQQLDHGLTANIAGFWLQPESDGILLVQSSGGNVGPAPELWRSLDVGAAWQQLTVPGGLPTFWPARIASFGFYSTGIVARSIQGQFHICVSDASLAASAAQAPEVECSSDSGQSWSVQAPLPLVTSQGIAVGVNLVDIANDGALLGSGLNTLYRLAVDSGSWQSLGTLPQPLVVYCPTPGGGILWAVPGTTGTNGNPQDQAFIAPYIG